ncbi:HNH endonuclease-domain-containing protein [Kalaharituber pfeilii]|nr:HNH endonuclease-domain-containing protein [Kalaharituber pfeilii]
MPVNREALRNVHIYDVTTTNFLGGFRQNGSVSEKNFLDMLHILLVTEAPLNVTHRSSSRTISATNAALALGEYDVSSDSPIYINNEVLVHRLISHSESSREDSFREGIRARDAMCVLSGFVNEAVSFGDWTMFEAAHIFPLQKESYWRENNFGRYITDMGDTAGLSKINSIQNGFLLRRDLHVAFDNYLIAVNPDDKYKITVFGFDHLRIDGRTLDGVCRDPSNPHRVSDHLLRWHFRQCVLMNMKGAGEPIFEHDFPPGVDVVGEIGLGPYGEERLRMELEARLAVVGGR